LPLDVFYDNQSKLIFLLLTSLFRHFFYLCEQIFIEILARKDFVEFQHPCRDRNHSHTLIQCTVDSIYWSASVVIYIFHICTRDHAYSDRLQTQITSCSRTPYSLMIGNYALMLIATDRLHVLEHILFLLTYIMCTIRTFSIVILSCPFQQPVRLC